MSALDEYGMSDKKDEVKQWYDGFMQNIRAQLVFDAQNVRAAAAGQLVLRGRGRGVSGQLPVLSAVHRGRHRSRLHGADRAHHQEYFPAGHRHEGRARPHDLGGAALQILVNLDVMMAKRKISAGELAERVGITPANLSILKNNKAKAIRFSTLMALCHELRCQPGDLLEFVDDQQEVTDGRTT